MKKFFKIILFFIGGIALLIAAVFFMTAGMADVADDFFKSAKAKDQTKMQIHLHQHIVNDLPEIIQYLNDNGMDQVTDSSWSSRAFVNSSGNISGELTTANNETIKTRMTFLKVDGDWKIYSIQKQDSSSKGAQAPTISVQKAIVHDAMKSFMAAGSEKSMKSFHAIISNYWKSQITVEQLDKAFGSIYQAKMDLRFLDNVTPEIENYSINKDGILELSGFFPANNVTIYFSQEYIYEGTQWKLFGFNYSSKKPE